MLKYNENWSYHALVEHLGISHSAVEPGCIGRDNDYGRSWPRSTL